VRIDTVEVWGSNPTCLPLPCLRIRSLLPLKGIVAIVEKRVPHYALERIQADVDRLGAAAFTKTALDGGRALGMTSGEMLAVIASLTRAHFYKSMTTRLDHRIWQDVYHVATPAKKTAYIKITMRALAPVIQFKEK